MVKPYRPRGSLTYYFRMRVPARFREIESRPFFRQSCGTRDLRMAQQVLPLFQADILREWQAKLDKADAEAERTEKSKYTTRGGLQFDDPIEAARWFCEVQRVAWQADWRETRKAALTNPESFWDGTLIPLAQLDTRDIEVALKAALREQIKAELRNVLAAVYMEHDQELRPLVSEIFAPPLSEEREFLSIVSHTYLAMMETLVKDDSVLFEDEKNLRTRWARRQHHLADALIRVQHDTPRLSDFLNSYLEERGKKLSAERADVLSACVRDLIQICGDLPVSAYTRNVATQFKGVLLKLPPNIGKRKDLKKLSLLEIAARADELGLPRQSPKNLVKKWAALGSLFGHAERTLDGVSNPFKAKSLAVEDTRAASEQWDPFSDDELRALLASDLPWPLYWLAWLGLCTGARPNELLQLQAKHVREHRGIAYLHFSPELRLKTRQKQSCVRSVPLHASLIELGFLDYVAAAGQGPLFPDMTVHKSGRMGDAVGKRFAYHLKKLGIKRPRLSLRSLRHNFKQHWDRHNQSAPEARERLMGHVVPGVAGRYGSGYAGEAADMAVLEVRAELLARVSFAPRDAQQDGPEADDVAA